MRKPGKLRRQGKGGSKRTKRPSFILTGKRKIRPSREYDRRRREYRVLSPTEEWWRAYKKLKSYIEKHTKILPDGTIKCTDPLYVQTTF